MSRLIISQTCLNVCVCVYIHMGNTFACLLVNGRGHNTQQAVGWWLISSDYKTLNKPVKTF